MKNYFHSRLRFTGLILLAVVCASTRADDTFDVPDDIAKVLKLGCLDCHAGPDAEANVRLDHLAQLELAPRLELLNKAQEQLHFGLMPPEDADPIETPQREKLAAWFSLELRKHNASRLEDKLQKPEYGNYVDHNKLFSGKYADLPGFTFDRRWLISEFIFDAKFNRIINHKPFLTIDGKRHNVIGSNNRRLNLTNPFLLPPNTGVRYYANESLNGGHLLTMITNAKDTAVLMTSHLAKRDRRYLPAVTAIMAQEDEHNRILTSLEGFLNRHIERVLIDLYGDRHDSLLPKFVPVKIKETLVAADGKPIKKSPFHAAQPGNDELEIIYRSMRRNQKENQPESQLLKLCEQEWFRHGDDARKIQSRITFMKNYTTEFRGVIEQHRYHQRHKPIDYRPLEDKLMAMIHQAVLKHRKPGDRFKEIIKKCLTEWETEFQSERIAAGPPSHQLIGQLVDELFQKILERQPNLEEAEKYSSLAQTYVENLGNIKAIEKLIQTLMLRSDFVYRNEFGQGKPDAAGRRMMSPRDASFAIAYALTDSSPDTELKKAAAEGRLETREDYRREVQRILKNRQQYYLIDESVTKGNDVASFTNMPIRELRFFREFFGYPKMLPIFKDRKRFGGDYDNSKLRLMAEADRLVEHVVENDKNVFETLLTTDKFYVFHSGDNAAMTESSQRIRKIYDYFKDKDWENFELEDLAKHKQFIGSVKMRGIDVNRLQPGGRYNPLRTFKTSMASFTVRFAKGQKTAAPYNSFPAHGMANASTRLGGRLQSPQVGFFFNVDLANWNYPSHQPTPIANRRGILTHPAWLIAHAQNQETDPIRRGKWIREKLLAGVVPDLPITVDAVIPENHHLTLRQRLENKTREAYCWKCHQQMNPLGLPFEIYDDFGRYRLEESLEHPDNLVKKSPDKAADHVDLRDIYKTLPVNSQGSLFGTGDGQLDGKVDNALDLIEKLAKSDRVRQSIIRYAFRYFMGRNEMLSDSKTLIDADHAYLESGGSFDAVIVSLLTSDSFIYRKPLQD